MCPCLTSSEHQSPMYLYYTLMFNDKPFILKFPLFPQFLFFIDVVFASITCFIFPLWQLIKLWSLICCSADPCLPNDNNVLRNATAAFLANTAVRRRFKEGWKGMASPQLPQITPCIPNEGKTMPGLPNSCLIKHGQIHQCCSVVATWLPFPQMYRHSWRLEISCHLSAEVNVKCLIWII